MQNAGEADVPEQVFVYEPETCRRNEQDDGQDLQPLGPAEVSADQQPDQHQATLKLLSLMSSVRRPDCKLKVIDREVPWLL